MPHNYNVLYSHAGRWLLDIDLQIALTLATAIFQLMHQWEQVWERDTEKLIERLNAIIPGQPTESIEASKNQFQFIPAIVWAEWDATMITFFGASGHYCHFGNAFYFFWDGGHVATSTKIIQWNRNARLPYGYKKAVEEIFNTQLDALNQ